MTDRSKSRWLVAIGVVIAVVVVGTIAYRQFVRAPAQPAAPELEHVRLRLQWIPQAQFAGFIVARELGYYRDVGLDVEILPAGPDLKPHVTVAAGSDDFGIGVINQIITARSNGVPLVAVMQIFQDSANRYVLKRQNQITSLSDLKGKPVGLWLGGDEAEFIAMLTSKGLAKEAVTVIDQGFTVVPFLEDQFVLSQVTSYNELLQLQRQGYDGDKLQILSPSDYDADILADVLFVSDATLQTRRSTVERFVSASLRGWQYAIDNPGEAVTKLLAAYPDSGLDSAEQHAQLTEVAKLVTTRYATDHGIGAIPVDAFSRAERILRQSGQLGTAPNPLLNAVDTSVVDAARHISP